jgi:hypothetical protein
MLVATKQTSNFSPSGAKRHAPLGLKSWGNRKSYQHFAPLGQELLPSLQSVTIRKNELASQLRLKLSCFLLGEILWGCKFCFFPLIFQMNDKSRAPCFHYAS